MHYKKLIGHIMCLLLFLVLGCLNELSFEFLKQAKSVYLCCGGR